MNLSSFRDKICDGFNLSELEDLCLDLDIPYENLPGTTIADKARELVKYCDRHGKLIKLLERCKILRPHLSWHEVAESTQQFSPQITEEKLTFLCWVYIKSNGSIIQPVLSDDIANVMGLEQLKTARIAQFLNQKSLVKFETWVQGIRISHQGIVKAEHDIVQAGFLFDGFPLDIVARIEKIIQLRSDYLHCLYMKSKDNSFESISGIEIANELNQDQYQLINSSVLHYLEKEGWLYFRGIPNVQITETGIEKVEYELSHNTG